MKMPVTFSLEIMEIEVFIKIPRKKGFFIQNCFFNPGSY